jgi:hypothetical protein
MTTTFKILIAAAAVTASALLVGTQRVDAIEVQSSPPVPAPTYKPSPAHGKQPTPVIRDHRANPTTWNLPKHYHNHHAGQGRRPR